MKTDVVRARVFKSDLTGYWCVRVMRGHVSLGTHMFPTWKGALSSALYLVKALV